MSVSTKHRITMMARITVPGSAIWHMDPVKFSAQLEDAISDTLNVVVSGDSEVVVSITEATGCARVEPKQLQDVKLQLSE